MSLELDMIQTKEDGYTFLKKEEFFPATFCARKLCPLLKHVSVFQMKKMQLEISVEDFFALRLPEVLYAVSFPETHRLFRHLLLFLLYRRRRRLTDYVFIPFHPFHILASEWRFLARAFNISAGCRRDLHGGTLTLITNVLIRNLTAATQWNQS